MSYDDICKLIVIKQAQRKMDREAKIAKDYMIKAKNHKSAFPRPRKTIVIKIQA